MAQFFDLPAEAFPFVIELYDVADPERRTLWARSVTPGQALPVPLARSLGVGKVGVRLTFPDGTVVDRACCKHCKESSQPGKFTCAAHEWMEPPNRRPSQRGRF